MLIRPVEEDYRIIAFFLGRIFLVVAAAALIPTGWALAAAEWRPLGSFLLMTGVFAFLGSLGVGVHVKERKLDWSHGMVVVALTWLVVPLIGSIPLALSGHYGSPLDAIFDSMSGLTTTGLALVQDLDHLASSLNFWRHLLQFLGGQGIVLTALTLFAAGGGLTLYYGEARDERILPSVQSTARFVWTVALVHMVVGVTALSLVGLFDLGFSSQRSVFHGLMIFFAGFDTGGFTPQSSSLGYYHSVMFEGVAAVLMVAGATSFGVHYLLWQRRARDATRNLETRTIVWTLGGLLLVVIIGLAGSGVFASVAGLSRQGAIQLISAHSGTGFSTVPSVELASWGGLALGGLVIAMALGGMGSSTAGGVKALRVGLTVKTVSSEVKKSLLPEGAVVSATYYQSSRKRLTPDLARTVMTVSLLYVVLFVLGTGVGIAYGVPLQSALFESVSAGASVGLSLGVTEPTMPVMLKVTYMLQMWAGRLEFSAIFALFGFLYAAWRGR